MRDLEYLQGVATQSDDDDANHASDSDVVLKSFSAKDHGRSSASSKHRSVPNQGVKPARRSAKSKSPLTRHFAASSSRRDSTGASSSTPSKGIQKPASSSSASAKALGQSQSRGRQEASGFAPKNFPSGTARRRCRSSSWDSSQGSWPHSWRQIGEHRLDVSVHKASSGVYR